MNRTLTEKRVLKQLDIPDWRHITKDKVIELATMLPKMDPEVAKKALEQFPKFAETSLDLVHDYKAIFIHLLDDCAEGNRAVLDVNDRILSDLEDLLHQDLTFEQKMDVMDQMRMVSETVVQFVKDDKQHKTILAGLATVAITGICGILAAVLGVDVSKVVKGIDKSL